MKKVICIPFAYDETMNSGVNVSKKTEKVKIYLKNAVVALCSAKYYNKECDVVFATNVSSDLIPKDIQEIFLSNEILIWNIPFDRYRLAPNYKWSLAFYKLCVLSHLIEKKCDYICYMDTDVYVQNALDSVWDECNHNILLYDVNHGMNTMEYVAINDEFTNYLGSNEMPTHYGGEFFAANLENAKKFENLAINIYIEMQERQVVTTKGDEFIISLAANRMKNKVKNASPYIYRFWTGMNFRLISTCYEYNPVIILHMPAEKEKGIITLFDRYFSKGIVPSNKKVWKICRLNHQPIYEKVLFLVLKNK